MFGRRMAFVVGTLVAMALGGASFSAALAPGPGSEPGPVTVETEADYWGSYKIVRVNVTHERADKPPVGAGAWADADRPPERGVRSEFEIGQTVTPRLNARLVGAWNEIWREEAPLVFKTLDKVCPALKNAC